MNKEFLRMQKLAGLITEGQYQKKMEENLEPDFNQKALDFLNQNKSIVMDAVEFFNNHSEDEDYEYTLVDTIYDFLNNELGEEWPKQISTPTPEEEEVFSQGWTDDKEEAFYEVLKIFLKM
jgi:3-oxoacyl-ACP reductase-like protein